MTEERRHPSEIYCYVQKRKEEITVPVEVFIL